MYDMAHKIFLLFIFFISCRYGKKEWVIRPKKYSGGGGGRGSPIIYKYVEHVTEKSDRSSLQGVSTQQDK